MDELEKIKMRYAEREKNLPAPGKGALYFDQQHRREKEIRFTQILHQHFGSRFDKLKLMEIGAGAGKNLHFFIYAGFEKQNIWANELLEERIEILKSTFPDIVLEAGDASSLDYVEHFDIVLQSTVFTSILDDAFKKNLADTMFRMVKPNGLILWYDFIFDNPRNKNVKGISKKEILKLFPEAASIKFTSVTLAPPIGRKLYRVYNLINFVFPFLRTHVIAEIYK